MPPAKSYVLSFSEGLSEELKDSNVTVTALCPGVTWTGFQETAQVKHMRLVRGPGMSAEKVAKIGYRALMRGRVVVVPGLANQMFPFVVRFIATLSSALGFAAPDGARKFITVVDRENILQKFPYL